MTTQLQKQVIGNRIYYQADRNLYDVTKPEYCKIIGNSHAVDADNGRIGNQTIWSHSEILGIVLDLEFAGYSIKRKPWFIPRILWKLF